MKPVKIAKTSHLSYRQMSIALTLEVQMLRTQLNAMMDACRELAEENERLKSEKQ